MPILQWLTREADLQKSRRAPFRLLEPVEEMGYGNPVVGNLLLQGDNLEHSQWLSMMYPRLELLRELLSEDGSIWISIDNNEGHYLKVVMDEIFGHKNFVVNVLWQKRTSPDARRERGFGLTIYRH
jgi:adenine-specific DNA-methyltransferase